MLADETPGRAGAPRRWGDVTLLIAGIRFTISSREPIISAGLVIPESGAVVQRIEIYTAWQCPYCASAD
jgi:hypothetical protein